MSETGSDFPPHKVVILAAGKGTRMKPQGTPEQELDPKVLIPFFGGNLIGSVLEAIDLSIIKSTPVIVVGFKADQVMDTLGRGRYNFVRQEKQLGTGHAVASAVEAVRDSVFTLVLYGDMPLIDAATINRIMEGELEITLERWLILSREKTRHQNNLELKPSTRAFFASIQPGLLKM